MSGWKDEAIHNYKEECFKQERPYQYELAMDEERGGRTVSSPPNCASGTIIYFPDEVNNVLNFEGINTEYIIFVSKYGCLEQNGVERLLSKGMSADIIYCDEDFTKDTQADLDDVSVRMHTLRTVWRKPDYSPDTLLSFPYIETCYAIKTMFARCVPALKKSPEISDSVRIWDFLLRATERTNKITHVPEVLFHRDLKWTMGETVDVGTVRDEDIYSALMDCYAKAGYQLCREAAEKRRGMFTYYDRIPAKDDKKTPFVSIIIPSKDQPDMLAECIKNIRFRSGDIPYEIIVVDNGSREEAKAIIEKRIANLPEGLATYIYEPFEFDFSRMCSIGAEAAKGEYLLFLNDDVEAVSDKFLDRMLAYATLPHVGAVGVKLLYPGEHRIQHVGIADINRGPTHKLITKSDDEVQYFGRNHYAWDVLAVTGACLMVDRQKYFQVGGFSDKMKVGYNDVDLCVKLFERGYFNVVNNECVMIHHESVSRGFDGDSQEKADRLKRERAEFYGAHGWLKKHYDPFYSKKLDWDTIEYKSYIVPEYQITDFRNKSKYLSKLPARKSDHVKFSIDNCGIERAISPEVEDAYVFDGWALHDKMDNALVDKFLLLATLDENGQDTGECIMAMVSPKYRSDIREVFPDVANVSLAGFECRIPCSKLDADRQYRIGVCVHKRGRFGKQKLMLGDIYEPGRGIITDKQILPGTVREGEAEE